MNVGLSLVEASLNRTQKKVRISVCACFVPPSACGSDPMHVCPSSQPDSHAHNRRGHIQGDTTGSWRVGRRPTRC